MILVRTVYNWLLAFNPRRVTSITSEDWERSDGKRITLIKLDASRDSIEVPYSVVDIVKAIDQHNSTGKSVSLVEEVKL